MQCMQQVCRQRVESSSPLFITMSCFQLMYPKGRVSVHRRVYAAGGPTEQPRAGGCGRTGRARSRTIVLSFIYPNRSINPTISWGGHLLWPPLRLTLPKQTKGREVLGVPSSVCGY